MNEGATDLSDVLIPPEDSAIPQALDLLRDRLESWRHLTSTWPRKPQSPAPSEEAIGSPDPVPPSTPLASAVEAEPSPAEKSRTSTPIVPLADPPPQVKTTRGLRAIETDEPDKPEPVEAPQSAHDAEDEALFAALPAAVAKAIRVQHRLFDGRKSVKELIEKYRIEHGDAALLSEGAGGKTRKDSWWKRVAR